MSQTSLSLFDESTPLDAPNEWRVPRRPPLVSPVAQRHLTAARRLSKRMSRYADQSPEQLRAGRLICRHLVAMLKEAETEPKAH